MDESGVGVPMDGNPPTSTPSSVPSTNLVHSILKEVGPMGFTPDYSRMSETHSCREIVVSVKWGTSPRPGFFPVSPLEFTNPKSESPVRVRPDS